MRYLLYIFILILLSGCGQEPILLGFSGEMTGRYSSENVATRNGAQLAVDVINQQGGIAGRRLKLLIRNDRGKQEVAREVDKELIEKGVVAIVGHMSSFVTEGVIPLMNETKTILFSPTVARFAGKTDYFFRTSPGVSAEAYALSYFMFHEMRIQEIFGVVDSVNLEYTDALWQSVGNGFEDQGGIVLEKVYLEKNDLYQILKESSLRRVKPQAIVFISSAIDVALMVQYARQLGLQSALIATSSAQNQELLAKGGRAIENLHLTAIYNPENLNPQFQAFVQHYQSRYRRFPTYGAAYGYETVLVLAEALKKTRGKTQGLYQALLAIKDFPAIQGTLSINATGDVERDLYIMKVKNGQFQVVYTFPPN